MPGRCDHSHHHSWLAPYQTALRTQSHAPHETALLVTDVLASMERLNTAASPVVAEIATFLVGSTSAWFAVFFFANKSAFFLYMGLSTFVGVMVPLTSYALLNTKRDAMLDEIVRLVAEPGLLRSSEPHKVALAARQARQGQGLGAPEKWNLGDVHALQAMVENAQHARSVLVMTAVRKRGGGVTFVDLFWGGGWSIHVCSQTRAHAHHFKIRILLGTAVNNVPLMKLYGRVGGR